MLNYEILLVDDDPNVLDIVGTSLGRKGFNVATASTGQHALSSYSERRPELIILDMKLPDMTGFELMDCLSVDGGVETPVVVLSSDGDVETRLRMLDYGAQDYLVKPVSLRELGTRIEHALQQSSHKRDLVRRSESLKSALNRGRQNYTRVTKELKRQLLSMKTLFSVSQDLNSVLDTSDMLNVTALTLLGELQISSMAIFSVERENDRKYQMLGLKGFRSEKFSSLEIDRDSEFVKLLSQDPQPRKIARNPDRSLARLLPDLRLAVFEYVTPINVKEETKGLIFTGPKLTADKYSDYDLHMMTFIANSAGIGMENARLLKQLQVTYVSTLKTLISIIEAKDRYTKGHTERVAAYAMAIANRMEFSEEDLRRVMFGALLHDIGKLGILENVLHKKGALDESEWKHLMEHPVIGAEVVEKMEFLTGVAEIVRHHHESWDGRGYPGKLVGEAIPLGARIVTVADSFDAMTTDRSYRKAFSVGEAIERLQAGAGTQFDPEIVNVFIDYFRGVGSDMVVAGFDGAI